MSNVIRAVRPAAILLALFPLASHGGPLWEPSCYAQIGGLSIAPFITPGLVLVLYTSLGLEVDRLEQSGRP
jgi:hypothetical protein